VAIGIITLMDEFTSIFYAPAEAHRFIGVSAIVFIAVTSVLIRFMSTRFVEIAEILEHHGLIGGGSIRFPIWFWDGHVFVRSPRSWSTTFSPPVFRRECGA